MKKTIALILVLLTITIAACSSGEQYGVISESLPVVSVQEVLLNPSSAGKEVRLKGTIKTQCGSNGCWFFLDDGTGQILILLNALNLGLPQSIGKKAEVSGIVSVVNQQAAINARGLKVN